MRLAKDAYKFSCSHLMILGPDHGETLHGHNYYVGVDVLVDELDPDLGMAFDYGRLKPLIKAFCSELDERILLPDLSPYLDIERGDGVFDVHFAEKHYVFPAADVVTLPIANLTCEELARLGARKLRQQMLDMPYWTHVRVHVEETRGQSVSYTLAR